MIVKFHNRPTTHNAHSKDRTNNSIKREDSKVIKTSFNCFP